MKDQKYCPKCDELRDLDNFCYQCGGPLEDIPKCKCGKTKTFGHTYCTNCGAKIVREPTRQEKLVSRWKSKSNSAWS